MLGGVTFIHIFQTNVKLDLLMKFVIIYHVTCYSIKISNSSINHNKNTDTM